jgi:hypothetical protein
VWAFTRMTLVCVVAVLCCSACGSRSGDAVEAAARGFYAAIEARDGAAACRLLAATTRSELEKNSDADCDSAILEEDLPFAAQVETIEVYGRNARVVLDADTAFLTEAGGGWQLMAAGCVERRDRPYDCSISGG